MNESRYPRTYVRTSPLQDVYTPHSPDEDKFAPPPVSRRIPHSAFVVVLGFMMSLAVALSGVNGTMLAFSDQETAAANSFSAVPLDFSVLATDIDEASTTVEVFLETGVGASENVTLSIVPITESASFVYRVSGSTSGDAPLCGALMGNITEPFAYTGFLSSLVSATSTVSGEGSLEVILPASASDVAPGMICTVSLLFKGWQENGQEDTTYHDNETVNIIVTATGEVFAPLQLFALPLEEEVGDAPLPELPPEEIVPTPEEEIPPGPPESEETGEEVGEIPPPAEGPVEPQPVENEEPSVDTTTP